MLEIDEIKNAYRRLLSPPIAGVVLADLASYCGFLESHGGDAYKEGQRDVFLHIMEMYGADSTIAVVEAIQAIKPTEREEQLYAESY
jgi:hypothetical protein